MDNSSINPPSPDDVAYHRALQAAKDSHAQGGTPPFVHQQQTAENSAEGIIDKSADTEGKKSLEGGKGEEGAPMGVSDQEGNGGGENISDPSDNRTDRLSTLSSNESNERGSAGEEEGARGSNVALGTGGGGGASSGVINLPPRDLEGKIRELESMQRHPLPKIHDAEQLPKAIASTFNPPAHLPPSDSSGYRPHGVNEHMRKGGGKAPHSQKMIQQPGGKYGQRY